MARKAAVSVSGDDVFRPVDDRNAIIAISTPITIDSNILTSNIKSVRVLEKDIRDNSWPEFRNLQMEKKWKYPSFRYLVSHRRSGS